MRNGLLQNPPWFSLLFLVAGGLCFGGCDSGGIAPDQRLKDGVALSGAEDADVAAVATHRDGEWLAAYSRERSTYVSEVVYSIGDGDRAIIMLDGEERPSLAVTGPYVLTFGKYNGTRADVGVVNTSSGEIETSEQVELGVDFGSLEPSRPDSAALSPAQATETAGYALTALVCSIAAMPVMDASSAGNACQASVLLTVAAGATEHSEWEKTAELLGWGLKTGVCGNDRGNSCLKALVDTSGTALEESQVRIDEHEQTVAQASAVVRYGGTWAYEEVDQSYFVIEKDLSYDISYSNFASCYFINRLELIGFSGNIFNYRIRRNNNTIKLKFDRVSSDHVNVTRLGDGREFKWTSASSQTLQTFLDNECSSSSAGAATKTLSQ